MAGYGRAFPEDTTYAAQEAERMRRTAQDREACALAELEAEIDAEDAGFATAPAVEATEPVDELTLRVRALESQRDAERAAMVPRISNPSSEWTRNHCEDVKRRIRLRRAEEAREAREREVGLPRMQAKWDARAQRIGDARDATIRRAQGVCRTSESAAREAANIELEELGPRPTLDAIEAVAA